MLKNVFFNVQHVLLLRDLIRGMCAQTRALSLLSLQLNAVAFWQETKLSQRDRATHYISWNLVNC